MQVDLSIEEIYKEELDLAKSIVGIVQHYKNKIPYNTVIFGAKYKAYLNTSDKYVICSCERKSIENRIELYKQQQKLYNLWQYYDYIYDRHINNPSLEYFLGLPKELNIDYSKDVISQIIFEDEICHRCCGIGYRYLIKQYESKKTIDAQRQIELENYYFANGFHYVPIYKKSYVLLDKLSLKDKQSLCFESNDFLIRDKVCTGYQKFIDNPNKKEQENEIVKFLEMPEEKQLYGLYVNKSFLKENLTLFKDSDFDFYDKIEKVCNKKIRDLQLNYEKVFSKTTSPVYEIRKLYNALIQDNFEDYNSEKECPEDFDEDEKEEYEQLNKLKKILTNYIEQYIDYGGDVHIMYIDSNNEISYPFLDLLDLIGGEKLNEKAGIKVEKINKE